MPSTQVASVGLAVGASEGGVVGAGVGGFGRCSRAPAPGVAVGEGVIENGVGHSDGLAVGASVGVTEGAAVGTVVATQLVVDSASYAKPSRQAQVYSPGFSRGPTAQ